MILGVKEKETVRKESSRLWNIRKEKERKKHCMYVEKKREGLKLRFALSLFLSTPGAWKVGGTVVETLDIFTLLS